MRHFTLVGVLFSAALAGCAQPERVQTAEFQKSASPAALAAVGAWGWQGADSKIATQEIDRVTDADSWALLWRRHRGADAKAPPVDFSKEMVVAVFKGRRAGLRFFGLAGVERARGEVIVTQTYLQAPDSGAGSGESPFLIFSLPRFSGRLRVLSKYSEGAALGLLEREDKIFEPLRD